MGEFGMAILATIVLVISLIAGVVGWRIEPRLRLALIILVPMAVCLHAMLVSRWR